MNLQNIKVADAWTSATNIKGRTEGPEFKDLVASIKEKGVLVPVLARKMKKKVGTEYYEVIAGNRRLVAAREAGLKEIPAQIVEMTDNEAREAQIIENLQRQDVHPLDEAEAYFSLVKTTADIKAVAAKVGKSVNYVQNRIMLCNLIDEAKKAYRAGEINDGHALEISRLSPGGDQQKCLTHVKQSMAYGRSYPVNELTRWIEGTFLHELAFQPWLKDKEAMVAVGPCRECPPETNTLFGEAKTGACTTTRCHKRKMKKYIEWMKEKNPGLVLISTNYSHGAGVLGEYDWERSSKGAKGSKPALIVEGKNRGKVINVSVKKIPVTQMTPEEKKKHEEEIEKKRIAEKKSEEARKALDSRKMDGMLKNIVWPMKESHLEPLFEIMLDRGDDLGDIALRRKLDGKKDEDGEFEDAEAVLRKFFAGASPKEKLGLIIEIAISMLWGSEQDKVMKKFN